MCFRSNTLSSQELLVELKPGIAKGSGHSSRVFSVKFHPDDSNVIVSGGWVRAPSLPTERNTISAGIKISKSFGRVAPSETHETRELCCWDRSPVSSRGPMVLHFIFSIEEGTAQRECAAVSRRRTQNMLVSQDHASPHPLNDASR